MVRRRIGKHSNKSLINTYKKEIQIVNLQENGGYNNV